MLLSTYAWSRELIYSSLGLNLCSWGTRKHINAYRLCFDQNLVLQGIIDMPGAKKG
jgi:hypothetical protein